MKFKLPADWSHLRVNFKYPIFSLWSTPTQVMCNIGPTVSHLLLPLNITSQCSPHIHLSRAYPYTQGRVQLGGPVVPIAPIKANNLQEAWRFTSQSGDTEWPDSASEKVLHLCHSYVTHKSNQPKYFSTSECILIINPGISSFLKIVLFGVNITPCH